MTDRSRKVRWLLWLVALGVAAGVVFVVWLNRRSAHLSSGEEAKTLPPGTFPLPPYSTSEFLNTGPEAHYVGATVCAECHSGKHQSWLLTTHSRALADLDVKAEPPDGAFDHKPSGRSYRVYRRDNQFRHEEILRTAEGKEIARVDAPIRYLIGSGNFTRSYLIEIDGFLNESPITWYTAKKQWGMSPGYDSPTHWGFERPANLGCLACHAGRVAPIDDSTHRMNILEKAIGCESCHGPGSLHEALHRAKKHTPGKEDRTIVNPAKLSRSRLEAVCGVCHINGPANILVRGRRETEYRPGMPLTDYRIDYRFDEGNDQMTVVGHIEQLRRSPCYQKSNDLTCLTCHDPHAREKPKDAVAFYRQKCLNCHTAQACRLEEAKRRAKDATDNCMACHMPRGDTDIPHIAFTHHRIGRHAPERASDPGRIPELSPVDDVSHLPRLDQQRNLGLAYFEVLRKRTHPGRTAVFQERARNLLQGVHAAGLRDPETATALAWFFYYFKKDGATARKYAREVVEATASGTDARVYALSVLAACEMEAGNYESARGPLEELVRLRRYANDWHLLGKCQLEQGDSFKALVTLDQALTIRPYRSSIHSDLAEAYRRAGDAKHAAEHREKAQWLMRNRQD